MSIVKLRQFQTLILDTYIDQVTKYSVSTNLVHYLHFSDADAKDVEKLKKSDVSDIIQTVSDLKKRMENIIEFLNIPISEDTEIKLKNGNLLTESIGYTHDIEKIEKEIKTISEHIDFFKNEIMRYEDLKRKLEFLMNINLKFNISVFSKFSFVEMTMGRLSKINYSRMRDLFLSDAKVLFYDLKEDEKDIYVMFFYLKSYSSNIHTIFNSLFLEVIELPSNLHDSPKKIVHIINDDIKLLEHEIQKFEIDKQKLKLLHGYQIVKIFKTLAVANSVKEISKFFGHTQKVVLCAGWIPERFDEEYEANLNRITNKSCLYSSQPAEEYYYKKAKKVKVPTLIENIKFFKPYELLVRLYGIPSYFEYDPTFLVGFIFTLLFGLMFGDLGQGAIIVLIGFLIGRKFKEFSGASLIIKNIGFSSLFFGLMYGECFGFSWLPPVIMSPMESTNSLFFGAVLVGIIILTAGILFNLKNLIRIKDKENLYFGKTGVTGLIFYCGTIVTALLNFFEIISLGANLTTYSICLFIWIIPILLMFFKEPLGHLVEHGSFKIHTDFFNFIITSAIEIFEILLSYASNTISFVRIAAFAINHVELLCIMNFSVNFIQATVSNFSLLK